MYFHVYLIYRFTRTFTDHSSVITRCWGFELQNGKSSLKSPQTLATQGFAPASFLSTPDNPQSIETQWIADFLFYSACIYLPYICTYFSFCHYCGKFTALIDNICISMYNMLQYNKNLIAEPECPPGEIIEIHRLYTKPGNYAVVGRKVEHSGSTVARYIKMKGTPQIVKHTFAEVVREGVKKQ